MTSTTGEDEEGWTEGSVPHLSPVALTRLAALLYVSLGSMVLLTAPVVPTLEGASRGGLAFVGIASAVVGGLVWRLPWERWPARATLWLIPVALGLVAAHNTFTAADGFRYGLFFTVIFAWLGLAHRPGTCVWFSPLLAVAYLAPLLMGGHTTAVALISSLYAVTTCVVVGETVAWVAERLRRTFSQLDRSERLYRLLFASNPQPMWVYDRETLAFLEVNDAAIDTYGYSHEQFKAMTIADIRPLEDVDALIETVRHERPGVERAGTWRHRLADGRVIDVAVTSHRVQLSGHDATLVTMQDMTERNALESQLRHEAFHDSLTGLPNRALFRERVEASLARTAITGRGTAVLLLDLDEFKTINDSLGHTAGDQLLIAAATRLEGCVAAGDTVARLGGDEFAVVLDDVGTTEDAAMVAERLVDVLRNPFTILGTEVAAQASAGIACSLGTPGGAEELLRSADIAMYLAKNDGKGCCRIFEASMYEAFVAKLELQAELRRTVHDGGLLLHYQPVVDLPGGQVLGAEALVRWQHPRLGMLGPDKFIPMAEDTGLIVSLGRWVLGQACRDAATWPTDPSGPELTLSVNLSARQLLDDDLVDDVDAALADSGLDPSRLTLEITESVIMENPERSIARLRALRARGVRLALDDFGSGYSSLSYLRQLPLDIIKIDKVFVDGVDIDAEAGDLVHAIVRLARTLRLDIVAEGVERLAQVGELTGFGCELAQGFHFARPQPLDQFVAGLPGGPAEPLEPAAASAVATAEAR